MKFDPTKPCQTRDGRPVRILCTDAKMRGGDWSICGLVPIGEQDRFSGYGPEGWQGWFADGRVEIGRESPLDLVNIPEKRTGWAVMFADGYGAIYPCRSDAVLIEDRQIVS